MKKFGLLLLILVGFFSCKQGDTGKFQVSGKYRNADKIFTAGQGAKLSGKVLLVEIPFGKDQNIQALDSAPVTGANASFELNAKGKTMKIPLAWILIWANKKIFSRSAVLPQQME